MDLQVLYLEHGDALRRAVARIVPAADVDDVMQETLLKAAQALGSFRKDANPGTWLHQIARNAALDHLRGRQHKQAQRTAPLQPLVSEETLHPAAIIAPSIAASTVERREMGSCIRDYVGRLRPDHRRILELKDIEGRTNVQIATSLGVTVGTIKIRLHRARAALRKALTEGCDFYQNDTGNLACDRRKTPGVSLEPPTSSKEVEPDAGTLRSAGEGRNQIQEITMSSTSTCSCAAPQQTVTAHSVSQYNAVAAEFVAIGAAIGSNCEPCLRYHVREALKVGISLDDIARAVATAEQVKATPAKNISTLAERLTHGAAETAEAKSECACAG